MSHLSLRHKVSLLIAGVLFVTNFATAAMFVRSIHRDGKDGAEGYRRDLLEGVRKNLAEQVEIASGVLEQYRDSADDPVSRARQQARAKATLEAMRFGGNGYFFAYQYDGTCRVLAPKPDWIGQNKWEVEDKRGVKYLQDLIAVARKGGDTTRYSFPKPGSEVVVDKLGYAKGFDKWGWLVGTGVYIDEIDSLVAARDARVRAGIVANTRRAALLTVTVIVLFTLLAASLAAKALKPLQGLHDRLEDISRGSGDLTQRVEVELHDEVGRTAMAFNAFVGKIQDMIGGIAGRSTRLGGSSRQVRDTAHETASAAEEMALSSRNMASAVEEASASLREIAASVSESGRNVTTIASALEEVTASLAEVSRSCQEEVGVARAARGRVDSTQARIEQLKDAAQDIGSVLEVIFDIAEQTKLLALNATIEAARAGESGKGFAVVAGEVKELARLSAESTEKIRAKVDAIQSQTGLAVEAMKEVTLEVSRVDDLSATILRSVEEQEATIGEISRNVADFDVKSRSIASGTAQSAQGLSEVSTGISQMHGAIEELARGATRMEGASRELDYVVEELGSELSHFRH